MDETGIEENLHRQYARAPKGEKVLSDVMGKKPQRTSVIAAYSPHDNDIKAPYAFNGYTDSKRFNGWIQKCLLPCLKPGMTVIMDNAGFHKSQKTKNLIESVKCRLLFQPSYSPDLNPTEEQWAILKARYKKIKLKGFDHYEAVNYAFNTTIIN